VLTLPALALALGSAALHAVWNVLLARANDVQAATAATFVLSVALVAPFALVWWSAQASVWPYALASTLLETAYVLALSSAYRASELSFVYPLTRGLAPVLALLGAVLLGHAASAAEVAGVVLAAAGVVLVREPEGRGDARALLLVVTVAATIAAYTLVDRAGIQHAGALTYFVLVLAGPCLVYPPLVGRRALRRELGAATVAAAAAANVGSFVLGLLALRRGAAAPVLAVRSSSIVIATFLAARVLREHVSGRRLAGSIVVFGGVAVLAL
jgi:drug/metabolite transporter (DMT)-like permease